MRAVGTRAPEETSIRSTPRALSSRAENDRLLDVPTPFHPIGRRNAREQRHVVGHQPAQLLGDAEDQPHAILEAAAIFVGSLIAERRKKLVEQIAVGGVDFDELEASLNGPPCSRFEGTDDGVDAGHVEGRRDGAPLVEW